MQNTAPRHEREIRNLVAVYAGFGSLWILLSNHLLHQWQAGVPTLAWLSLGQGFVSVVATSALLYGVLHWREQQLGARRAQLTETEPLPPLLFTENPQACWIHEPTTLQFLAANAAASERCGYSVGELLQLSWHELAVPETVEALVAAGKLSRDRQPSNQRGQLQDRRGELHAAEMLVAPITYAGRPACLTLWRDPIARQPLAERSHQSAVDDLLTQLPNKTWFLAQLSEQLQATRAGTTSFFTILFIELERFNAVKYSLGHRLAEVMLAATVERLQTCLNLAEPVARVGDCSLAIRLDSIYTALDAEAIAEYIHQQMSQPLEVEASELFSPVSIGIAIVDSPDLAEQRSEDLLQAADTAMNHARQKLRATYAIFEPAMFELAAGRFHLETDLRQAIARQEFTIFYQPIVALDTGQLVGFESLVRWQIPNGTWVAPEHFIPVAEETGLIGLIDWWILGEASKQLGLWQQQLPPERKLVLSINASGALLSQLGFLERLRQVLATNSIQRGSLILEVTERVIVEHHLKASGMLNAIKNLGIQLAIDDFGTGYSCLERLHQLPIDILKIDRSFIELIIADPDSLEIVRAILTLARGLGMSATAEGAETVAQVKRLQALDCEFGQGYFFAEPLPSSAATQLLDRQWQW
ncbi:MAG: phosphodiesterase [Spirulinaceae cyanobacterium SM2_1_0]|nr:phosphodiesterase [Spirulinaceae cyanobacterium SM2_1_0]